MKTVKNSRKKAKSSTLPTPIPDCYTWSQTPILHDCIPVWKQQLENYTTEFPHAKSFTEFRKKHKISRDTFMAVIKKFPELREIYQEVAFELGERMWAKAVDNQANLKALNLRQWRYDPEFVEDDKRADDRANKLATSASSFDLSNLSVEMLRELLRRAENAEK